MYSLQLKTFQISNVSNFGHVLQLHKMRSLYVPVGSVRTLFVEFFAEIEDPIDGRRGWPDFEVIEIVVGAVEDRAVLVGGPRRKLSRGRQPGRFGMTGPVGPQRLVQHGRRG